MKKPAQVFLIIVLMACSVGHARAQKVFFLFAHGLYASPVESNFKSNYTSGLGAEGGFGIGFNRTFFVGTVGYTSFQPASSNKDGRLSYVPIKIGLRHYLFYGKVLFFNADAGMAVLKDDAMATSQSKFTADAGLGLKLGPVDACVNYNGFLASDPSSFASWIDIKVGWRIGF